MRFRLTHLVFGMNILAISLSSTIAFANSELQRCNYDELIVYEFCIESASRVQVVRKSKFSKERTDLLCAQYRELALERNTQYQCPISQIENIRTNAFERVEDEFGASEKND